MVLNEAFGIFAWDFQRRLGSFISRLNLNFLYFFTNISEFKTSACPLRFNKALRWSSIRIQDNFWLRGFVLIYMNHCRISMIPYIPLSTTQLHDPLFPFCSFLSICFLFGRRLFGLYFFYHIFTLIFKIYLNQLIILAPGKSLSGEKRKAKKGDWLKLTNAHCYGFWSFFIYV